MLIKKLFQKNRGGDFEKKQLQGEVLAPQYNLLGNFFLEKGDTFLARKMYLLASLNNPYDKHILDLIKHIDEHESKLNQNKTKKSNRKFDFYIVPSAGGSTTLIHCLNLRPDFMVPMKHDFDNAILNDTYESLLTQYSNRLNLDRRDIKLGLVQHMHIGVGVSIKTHLHVAKSVASITNSNKFIQTVRDPISFIRSNYFNHVIEGGLFNLGLSFKFANKNTIFDNEKGCFFEIKITHSSAVRFVHPSQKGYAIKKQKAPVVNQSDLIAVFSERSKIAKFHEIGTLYNRHFPEWLTIDLFHEDQKEPDGGITKVVEILGGHHYRLPVYDSEKFGQLQRLMWRNWVFFKYKEHVLCFILGIAGFTFGCSTFPYMEVCWLKNEELSQILGLNNAFFSLNINIDMWQALPTKLRQELINSEVFEKIMEEIIFPHWKRDYLLWKNMIKPFRVNKLNHKQLEIIRNTVTEDISLFLKRHPKFEHIWPSLDTLFSHRLQESKNVY